MHIELISWFDSLSGFDHPGVPVDEEEGGVFHHSDAFRSTYRDKVRSVLVLQDFQYLEVIHKPFTCAL